MTPRTRKQMLQAIAFMVIVGAAVFLIALVGKALAKDVGQWGDTDPEIRHWYQTLMMPDLPYVSCCGEADSYWADDVFVKDGKTYALITDDRDDAALHRSHRDRTVPHLIPDNKLERTNNPTGHNVIFLSGGDDVYCFIFGAGT